MQKKILAAAVAALCGVSGTAIAQQAGSSNVQLWGIVDAAVRHTNNQGPTRGGLTEMVGGGMSESRWGLKVNESLGGGVSAFVELENRFKSDTGAVPSNYPFFQLSYIGIQGPFGRLSMGRQWNVLFDVVTSTYASFPYSPYMDAYKPELGMAAGARTNNSLKYAFANADRSFAGALQYSFAEGNDTKSIERGALAAAAGAQAAAIQELQNAQQGLVPMPAAVANGTLNTADYVGMKVRDAVQTYGASAVPGVASGALKTMGGFLRFSKNGISAGAGFLRTELPGGSDLDAWTLGGSYRSGPLYINMGYGVNKIKINRAEATDIAGGMRNAADLAIVSAMWSGQTNGGFQPGNADKRQMFKVGFGYQLTPQINAGMHYFHAKQSGDKRLNGPSNGKADFLIAAVDYAFSKRTDAYFAIDHTKVKGGSAMAIENTQATGGVAVTKRTGMTIGLRHRF